MGRRKIQIQEIKDPRLRYTTFTKRKTGLIKKAAELSRLCQIKMLLMFEDISGDVIKYSTHGIYDPNKYFDNSRPSPYVFTFEDYPRFFGKEQKTGDASEKNSLKGINIKTEDHYLAEEELSMGEEDAEDNDESDEEISSIKNLQREFKRHLKVSNGDSHNHATSYKAKLRDSLKIFIPKENGSQSNVFPAGGSNKNQTNSDFAKNLQALLMMQAQHARNLQIQPITFGESQESENKPSEANSARVSSTPTNRTNIQPVVTSPNFNPNSTPTKKDMPANAIIPNTVNATSTNMNRIPPANLKINYAKGFQPQMEFQRMSFSQDEGSPRYPINSRPPSLLNSSLHSSVDYNIPTSRRSSLSSLLDLIKHDEKVDEDHLGDLLRAKSYNHSRVASNMGTILNRIDPRRLDDAFYSRKPPHQNFPNGQFFPNSTQKGMQSTLNFDELQLLGRDNSKMSVEPNNSQFLNQSQLTSRSGEQSESVDRFALKQLNNAVLNEAGSRSHSKDSHDNKDPQRRNSGTTGMRISSIPLSSKTILGREERSPLRNPNYDIAFDVNPARRETASIDSRKSGENSSINLGWGVWNEPGAYPNTSVKKDLDTTRGKLNISGTSSIFKSPRPEKKVKPC